MLTELIGTVRDTAVSMLRENPYKYHGYRLQHSGLDPARFSTKYRVVAVLEGGLRLEHEDDVSKIDVWHPWLTIPTDMLVDIATHGGTNAASPR